VEINAVNSLQSSCSFNSQQFCSLLTKRSYWFHMILTANSDYFVDYSRAEKNTYLRLLVSPSVGNGYIRR
jgi:hypothetical protein